MYHRNIGSIVAVVGLMALHMPAAHAGKTSRIVNGQEIDISDAPYTVQLRYPTGQPFCGGTLVKPQYVITAAHCFGYTHYSDVTVVGNITDTNEIGQERRIVNFILPAGFSSLDNHNDVAILKLDRPMENLRTVNLCSQPMMTGQTMQISGWGKTVHGGTRSPILRTVSLPVIPQNECQQKLAISGLSITDAMICALHPSTTKDSCHGDSGGPGIFKGELCGIVSWGLDCASGTPSVYTNVFRVRKFIEDAMNRM